MEQQNKQSAFSEPEVELSPATEGEPLPTLNIEPAPIPEPELPSEPELEPEQAEEWPSEPIPELAPEPIPDSTLDSALLSEPLPILTTEPDPEVIKRTSRKGFKVFVVILLVIIAVAGIGYSVYAWSQNKSLQASSTAKDAEISTLNAQVASLKASGATTTITAVVGNGENIIFIKELGISITVPDSIKDLTYSYTSFADGPKAVGLSTQSITDKYNKTNSCTSFDSKTSNAAFGYLEKVNGKYVDGKHAGSELVKQFSGYYIAFSSAQSACADQQGDDVLNGLKDLRSSLATVKEL